MELLIHSQFQLCKGGSLGIDDQLHPTLYNGCNYLSMVGLKANHLSKRQIEEDESENCGVKNVKAKVPLWPVSCRGKTSDHFLRARPLYLSIPIVIPHYGDVIMSAIASQITGVPIVYLTGYSGANQRKHQSSMPLAFVRGIHRWPVNSPHKGPVTPKMFPFDDVIMLQPIGTDGENGWNQLGVVGRVIRHPC